MKKRSRLVPLKRSSLLRMIETAYDICHNIAKEEIHEGKKSLYSVNHGAGRRLSRSKAAGKKGKPGLISDKAFKDSMQGIHLITKDRRRIKEEAPGAYKDIDEVINIVVAAGLALPVARMRPLAVLKG